SFWSAPAERSGDGALDHSDDQQPETIQSGVAASLWHRTPKLDRVQQTNSLRYEPTRLSKLTPQVKKVLLQEFKQRKWIKFRSGGGVRQEIH
ncbi:MAG: hypothetical protein QOD75_1001, partial [Blastocatellia bacterium]|nr:hypothetical protein [Blastocatellia bacterium]